MRLRPLLLLACTLLFCSAAAVACGGGGGKSSNTTPGRITPQGTASGSLQEYFQKVQALNAQSLQQLDAMQGQLSPNLPEDQTVKILRDAIPQEAAIMKELRDGLQQLSPPPEVKAAHQEAIDALTAFIEFSQKAADQTANATSVFDVATILGSKEANSINTRLNESCLSLVKAAADHGITIDLGCAQ